MSEEKRKNVTEEPLFKFVVSPRNTVQALFIHAIVMPELEEVLTHYAKDLIELAESLAESEEE